MCVWYEKEEVRDAVSMEKHNAEKRKSEQEEKASRQAGR